MVASVNVQASWRETGVLQIEVTAANMDLLLEEPTAESALPWAPTLEHENMSWVGTRSMIRYTWCDSKKMKKRHKHVRVGNLSDMDESGKHVAVVEAAEELQAFYESNHNLEKDMDTRKRDRGSDDGASDESARCEPVHKDAKTAE